MRYSDRGVGSVSAILLSMLAATTVLHAQRGTAVRGWRASPTAQIKIHAPSGTLEVEGWAEDSVAIYGSLAKGEAFFGGGSLTGLKLGAEGSATSGVTRLLVRVPHRAHVVVRSGAADAEVRGVMGSIDVGSAAGDVRIAGEIGSVTAESLSGSVEIAGTIATLRARTTRGALDVAGEISEATLTSVSGPVTVVGLPVGRLRIETVDGRVGVRGRLAPSGSLDIETFGGAVHLEFPPDQHAALDLRASSGGIIGRIEGPPRVDLSAFVAQTGTAATLGRTIGTGRGAAPAVTIRTFRGRITVDAVRNRS